MLSAAIAVLQQLIDKGYQVGVCSFASRVGTQRVVLDGVAEVNRQLTGTLAPVILCARKLLADKLDKASLTGHTGAKCEEANRAGAAMYFYDQKKILAEIQYLQEYRPLKHRTLCVHSTSDSSLQKWVS